MMDQANAQAAQVGDSVDFPYEPLTPGQIRLVTVHLNADEILNLSLENYTYDADLQYDAFSYAWNPSGGAKAQPQVRIRCNSASIGLSLDLSQAIKSLATLKVPRPIWIDYICIDQKNIKEKEWQLKLMGQYYSQAKMVWIWLGQSHGYSDLALEEMSRLSVRLPTLRTIQPITNEWLVENEFPQKNDGLWDSIDYIFTREWFNRLWTMQEFVLAAQTTFVCGLRTASGPQLVTVAQEFLRLGLAALSRRGRIPRLGYKDGYHFSTFHSRYQEAKGDGGSISLHLALQLGRFKESKGSNEHDRVFALLGLLHPDIIEQIPVHYDMPWWDMYIEVGKISLKNSSHLDLLIQCQSTWRPKELPSWCPNFVAGNEAAPFSHECYFAGFMWGMICNPPIEFSIEQKSHIVIEGARLAAIASVAHFSEKWDIEKGPLDGRQAKFVYTLRWMNECLEMARQVIPESYFQPVPEAFLRTLIADVVEGHKTGHSYEELQNMWNSAQVWISCIVNYEDISLLNAEIKDAALTFLDSVFHVCRFRRFFVTTDYRLALGPDKVTLGDQILVIKEANMPFVIREHEKSGIYTMLGPAYVRGLMMGQVPKMVAAGDTQWGSFEIA